VSGNGNTTAAIEPGHALAEFMSECWNLCVRDGQTIRQSDTDMIARELAGTNWSVAPVNGRWVALRDAATPTMDRQENL
jgi:hypothetical protein